MASGSYSGTWKGYTIRTEWTSSIDILSNSSTITAKHYLDCKKEYGLEIGKRTHSCTVNGIKKEFSVSSLDTDGNESIYLGTTTYTVEHNSDGKKTVSASTTFSMKATIRTEYHESITASGTMVLDDIPRYATSNQSLKSKTSSSITMNWSSDNTIDYIWYSKDNGSYWTGLDVTDGTSGSYTISGLAANTTYNIKTRVRRKDSQLTTDSSALSVTTYAKTVPTISLSSKSINSITVTSGCNVAVSSTKYRIKTSNGNYGNYQDSATFGGLSPNTTYVIEVYKVGQASGETGTATLTVATYDIGKISSAPNIKFGDTARITKSNPSSSTNNLRIETLNPTTTIATRNGIGDDYTITFSDTEWDELYRKLGTNNSITLRYVIDTICNSIIYNHWTDKTLSLTGNQKTAHIGVNGVHKRAKVYLGVNGTVKKAVMWIGNNGRKRCI